MKKNFQMSPLSLLILSESSLFLSLAKDLSTLSFQKPNS